jgi:hypothetical protein
VSQTATRRFWLQVRREIERYADHDKDKEVAIREKVRKGSPIMPGFEYSLEPAQIDQIVAFLKTVVPLRDQTAVRE